MTRLFLSLAHIKQVAAVLIMLVGLVFISHELDNDIYFLLTHGRYVMEQGVPTIEPFTIHEGLQFLMQQWLAATIFWNIYAAWGAGGLIALVYIMAALLIASLYYLYRLLAGGNKKIALIMASLVGIFICLTFMRTRPQIFSTLILVWEVIILELATLRARYRLLALLPVLSVLLVNLHAAMWQMLVVLMLPYIAEIIYESYRARRLVERRRLAWLLAAAVAVVLAGLVNPYGLEAMTYVWRSYGYASINAAVSEMHPVSFAGVLGKVVLALFAATLMLYYRHGVRLRYWLLTLGLMYLAGTAYRSVFLFVTIGMAPLAYIGRGFTIPQLKLGSDNLARYILLGLNFTALLAYFYRHGLADISELELPTGLVASVGLVALYLVISYIWQARSSAKDWRGLIATIVASIYLVLVGFMVKGLMLGAYEPIPKRCAEYILAQPSGTAVKVWTDYNTGNYLEFCRIPVYLDTRAEVFISANNGTKDIFSEYIELERGRLPYYEFLARYDFDYILTTSRDIMYSYLAGDASYECVLEYDTDYRADDDVVAVRLYKRK